MPPEPSPQQQQQQIGYAPPRSHSRRLMRRLWLPAFLLLVLASSYWWGPPVYHRAELEYWYGRAAGYAPPSDGAAVWETQRSNPWYRGSGVVYPWARFYRAVSPPGLQSGGTAFVGGRRTRDAGREVLVAVDVLTPTVPAAQPEFHVRVFRPGAGWNPPRQFIDDRATPLPPPKQSLRVFAGRADPADESHFTIPFDADGQRGVIDGWVREDRVDLEVRPAPLTRPLPASPG
jgi:hypothetical protein